MVRLSINIKLILSFFAVIMLFGSVSLFTNKLEENAHADMLAAADVIEESYQLQNYIVEFYSLTKDYLYITEKAGLETYKSQWVYSQMKINKPLGFLRQQNIDLYSLSLIESNILIGRDAADKLLNAHNLLLVATDKNEIAELNRLIKLNLFVIDDTQRKTREAVTRIIEISHNKLNEAIINTQNITIVSRVSMLTALIFSLFLSLMLSRSITVPLRKLKEGAEKIGEGKLDTRIEIKSKDEFGELASSFNKMVEDLKKSTISINDSKGIIEERTSQLNAKIKELEIFNKLAVGRELKMIELKKRVKEMEEQLGKK